MERRVVILDMGYGTYADEQALMGRLGYTVDVFEGPRQDLEGRIAFARGAIGAFVRWTVLDAKTLDAMPSVKYIVRYGVGYDNVDVDAVTARGVMFSTVQGYANHSVSDHALALILSCVRDLKNGVARFRSIYNTPPRDHLPDLKDMTLGIVGLGRIGGTLCGKARGLFKRVLACDPYIPETRFASVGAVPCDFNRLLEESDAISIHCNLTDETRLLFDQSALARMRPTAILVNTARGPIVDENALLDALNHDRLFAAGLDVYWEEPPPVERDALLNHPHVVGTGHYAWYSTFAGAELQRRAAENMATMLRGEIPEDCLNASAFRKQK